MRTLKITILSILVLMIAVPVWAGSYQYLSPAALKQKIVDNSPIILVDIQVEEEFSKHHLVGAIDTYAYPVKSAADRQKLDAALNQLLAASDPVVIVCPRGGGGAKRAYDYMADRGVASERLFILEKGQSGWPYPELLEKTM